MYFGKVMMSDFSNVPPAESLSYQMPPMENPVISQYAVELLRKMGFWTRIFAVVLFISAGLMIACGPFMVVFGTIRIGKGGRPGGGPEPEFLLIGLAYLAFGALYLIPAVYLNRFAGKAKAFAQLKDMQDLEAALGAQKSFWKFVSILVLVIIGLYLLLIPIAIVGGIMAARP